MSNLLKAYIRSSKGKGPSRRLRLENKLPGVLYGKGQTTLPIIVCPKETSKILRGPLKRNVIIDLEIYDEKDKKQSLKTVMIKERQIHKSKRSLIHVDFVEIDKNKPVNVSIPVILTGKSEAVVQGGKLEHVLQKIRLSAPFDKIPENISVDVSNLGFGSTHVSDISLLPGLKLLEKPKVVLLTIKRPRGATKEEEAEGQKAQAQAAPAAAQTSPNKK